MKNSRMFYTLWVVFITSVLLHHFVIFQALSEPNAPPPNPFIGTEQEPTVPSTPEEDNLPPLDPIDNFGFEPPAKVVPANPPSDAEPQNRIPPKPESPTKPQSPPTQAKPVTPPKPRSNFSPPDNTAQPTISSKKAAPKLEEYLSLDPSVKGLEVQNFDLQDQEMRDVVTLISKLTGKNFILDSKVRGKITIIGPSQVTLDEAYQAFLTALEANGLTTVKSGKFIRIIEAGEARRSPVDTYSGEYAPKSDQFITRIFQLKFINADEVAREFRDLATRQGKLFAYEPTNSIIITDTGSNIFRIEQILNTLDVKGFETSLHVLPIRNTSAKQISEMLDQIYDEDGKSKSRSSAARSFKRTSMERTRGGGIISKIIPDELTNSLVILANEEGYNKLEELVAKLDVKVTETGRIHVYYCEYAKAEDLAATLASLTSGSGAASSRSSRSRMTRPEMPGAPTTSARGSGGPISAELFEGVKVTSDAATNALVITANSADFQAVKKVIRKLDIPRLQVFIESAIIEVTLDGNNVWKPNYIVPGEGLPFAAGFMSMSSDDFAKYLTGSGVPEGTIIPVPDQGRTSATIGGQIVNLRTFMGILQFISQTTNTSILSTPQIIALDNEKATFKAMDKIPVQTSSSVASAGSLSTTSFADKEVGISVTITPHVNAASGNIRLELEQQVDTLKPTSFVPEALQKFQQATTTRVTNTNVVVKDNDFVMLGGLMSDKVDDTYSKIPLLGDIPILGWLFKSKTSKIVKTNLIFLLHPRIIGTSLRAANLIDDKLQKRSAFIEEQLGGDDKHQREVTEIREQIENQKMRGKNENTYIYGNDPDPDEQKKKRSAKSDVKEGELDAAPLGDQDVLQLPSDQDIETAPSDRKEPPNTAKPPVLNIEDDNAPLILPKEPDLTPSPPAVEPGGTTKEGVDTLLPEE